MGKAGFTDQEFDFIHQQREAVKQGKLLGIKCKDCGHIHTVPTVYCIKCQSPNLEIVELPITGKIYTYTVLPMVVPERFAEDAPYAWAVIELDDGSKVSGWIPYVRTGEELKVGQRVKMVRAGYKPGIVFERVKE